MPSLLTNQLTIIFNKLPCIKSRELVPDSILRLYLVAKICRWKAEIHKAFEGCKTFQPRNFQSQVSSPGF